MSLEVVVALLRDGKFHVNPATDTERNLLAKKAAAAIGRGLTRGQFGSEARLSRGKLPECWRDAHALYPAAEQ